MTGPLAEWNPPPLAESFRPRPPPPGTGLTPITNAQNRRLLRDREKFRDISAARFDLQFTTEENRSLWSMSDMLSVDASANFMVRRTLRMRCRYAYHNNPFAIGMANRLAKFVIGTGPTLHLSTGTGDAEKAADKQVEDSFNLWSTRVKRAQKLRTSRTARVYNGEGFNLLRTNPKVRHPVKLDPFEVEADQVTSPLFGIFPSQYPDQWFDGKILDPWGNTEIYHVLRQHPGAFGAFLVMGYEFDPWPARYVLHDYARLRPAQQRGIPDMAPVAQHYEELRRYGKSVLAASETAADWAGWVETLGPTDQTGTPTEADTGYGDSMDYVTMRRRQFGVLPGGATAKQWKAEQPTTQMPDYVMSQLVEISQVLDMPLFIVCGDARIANMSSAYVVSQSFMNTVTVERQEYDDLNDQTFEEWLIEARQIPGIIPDGYPDDPPHSWRWPQPINHADPQKVSIAMNQMLKNGLPPSYAFAQIGLDFDELAERNARDFGVSVKEWKLAFFEEVYTERGNPPPILDENDEPVPGIPPRQNQRRQLVNQ